MQRFLGGALSLVLVVLTGCVGGPTQAEIEGGLDAQLASAVGSWTGVASDGSLTLSFRLNEAAGGQLQGSGTMQERGAAASRSITVGGTYQRPALALTLEGLSYEGRAVRGSFQGSYTTTGGIADTLVLTADGYSRRLGMLLQESAP